MSPAAVEVRSPMFSSSPKCSSATIQDPEINPQTQFVSSFSFPAFSSSVLHGDQHGVNSLSCNHLSEMGPVSASDSQRLARSRPRLMKVRKRVATQQARLKVDSSEVGSSFSNSVCSNNEFVFSADASKFEGMSFVFGANRRDSVGNLNHGERKSADNVHKNLDTRKLENVTFVFGAQESYRASSAGNEYGQSRPSGGTSVADDRMEIKVESEPLSERFDNSSFNFSCTLENLNTDLKLNSEKGDYNEFMERYIQNDSRNMKLDSGVECGSHNGHAEKLNSSGGRTNVKFETITAMNGNQESVSFADTSKLAFMINSKEEEVNKTVGKPGSDGCSNLKTEAKSDYSKFVFGNSWFGAASNVGSHVSDFGVKMEAKSTTGSQKVEALNVNYSSKEDRILKEDLGRDIFIFGSSSLNEPIEGRGPDKRTLNNKSFIDNASINVTAGNLESNTDMDKFSTESNNIHESVLRPQTMFTLPDEMKNLNINDTENVDGYEKPECSTDNFTETSSSSGGCRKPSSSSSENLGNTNDFLSGGFAGATDRDIKDHSESSGESKTELRSKCQLPSASVGCSSEPFHFPSECSESCDGCHFTQHCVNDGAQLNRASTTSSFSSADLQSQTEDGLSRIPSTVEVEKNDVNISNDLRTSTEFKIPQWDPSSFKENLFSDLNQNSETNFKSKLNKIKRSRKIRGNMRQIRRLDKVLKEGDGSQIHLDSPGSCTPMDFSPYQETISVDQYSKEMSSAFSHSDNSSAPWTPNSTASNDEKDGVLLTQRKGVDAHNGIWKSSEPNNKSFGCHREEFSVHSCPFEGFDSKEGTVCPRSKTEQFCGSYFAGVDSTEPRGDLNLITDTLENICSKQSGLEDIGGRSFTFSASSAMQASISATKRQNRKKNRKKSNFDSFVISPNPDIKFGSSFEFSPFTSTLSHSETAGKLEAEENIKQGHSFYSAIQETCEKWRLRGNQAYKNGDLSKAEDLYTQGIDSVPLNVRLDSCLNSLMLCYSNRAATRMSLGKIRDALGDCQVACELDPNFLKVQVRAANCHLLLGEIENASQVFNKCLESRDCICLDRRMIIEAADGLQKAQKVAESTRRSFELMEQKTDDATLMALNLIAEAISISLYSEKLLEMKAEALFMLQRYEEAIELCEQSLSFAEKNCVAENAAVKTDVSRCQSHPLVRFWRWCLIAKAFFYLGKFEAALDTVGKLEKAELNKERIKSLESSFTLADTINELLRCKKAGNEAFRSGKYTEAVEHYTVALSVNVQSRSFTAVCLCNRAAAYQALGQIADAIADCSLAIALDENYPKAFSRRANLHEMIRDYGQAAKDLQNFILIVENQSDGKVKQFSTPNRSTGSVELKKARRNMPLMEEAAKKGISLDLYLILGVKASDTAAEIKKAYRKAALRHHPDKAGQFLARTDSSSDGRLWKEISQDVYKDADRLFKIIGEAYAVLSDPNKRSHYDLEEETRKFAKECNRGSNSKKSSNVYGSPFDRSPSGRNSRENWKSWGNSYSRW